jgi:glutamate racemase
MSNDPRPIGLFDSGVGGLTVLKHLRRALPNERFIYLGDTARTPYGSKSSQTIRNYTQQCAQFLFEKEVKLLVIACNTASSALDQELLSELRMPVVGMIKPAAAEALKITKTFEIGVLGTRATISSTAYETEVRLLNPKAQVTALACPLFVPLVEENILDGKLVELAVEHYLKPIKSSDIDSLILGCTHYPLLRSAITSYLGSSLHIIDSGEAAAKEVVNLLKTDGLLAANADRSHDSFYLTDSSTNFEKIATQFLGERSLKAISIESF